MQSLTQKKLWLIIILTIAGCALPALLITGNAQSANASADVAKTLTAPALAHIIVEAVAVAVAGLCAPELPVFNVEQAYAQAKKKPKRHFNKP